METLQKTVQYSNGHAAKGATCMAFKSRVVNQITTRRRLKLANLKYIASRPFSLLLYYIPSPSITEPVVAVSQHIGDDLSRC